MPKYNSVSTKVVPRQNGKAYVTMLIWIVIVWCSLVEISQCLSKKEGSACAVSVYHNHEPPLLIMLFDIVAHVSVTFTSIA